MKASLVCPVEALCVCGVEIIFFCNFHFGAFQLTKHFPLEVTYFFSHMAVLTVAQFTLFCLYECSCFVCAKTRVFAADVISGLDKYVCG